MVLAAGGGVLGGKLRRPVELPKARTRGDNAPAAAVTTTEVAGNGTPENREVRETGRPGPHARR